MEITEKIIHQLYQTTRIISTGLNQQLEPCGIYSSEWAIITTVKTKGAMSQTALAKYLNIEPPAISKSLANLERKGLIERREGCNKREKTVMLTALALGRYTHWQAIVRQQRQQLLAGLSEERLNSCYGILKDICNNAQPSK
ncbi:MarR family winged helix-turn-helix transcriptional regulator [Sporomusa termitida]|uniref:Transcriptional regulator SlyA n=1 Tax=Sporomusa termitida TaxID=2377 RepID=A0A517E0M4_9FIRM|nr:MarR family transcriptional regulator [Sporomusa termitida]QDR83153.1 Transcriptional regulator SlyA [Sporomusa termitida]